MRNVGLNLTRLLKGSSSLDGVRRTDLQIGDVLLVTTRNSVYTLRVLQQDAVLVSGGWFDRRGLAPLQTTIVGCTWGGCMICPDFIAACGMNLEFGNRVVTSTIQKVCVLPHGLLN